MSTGFKSPPTATTSAKVSPASILREDIGRLGWLAIKTRPDIALAANRLQRRTASPRQEDANSIKIIHRYLQGTSTLGIPFGLLPKEGLIDFVDVSHADTGDGKSTEAYIFYFAGAPISWASRPNQLLLHPPQSPNTARSILHANRLSF